MRHLDLLDTPVYLRFRLPRYRCDCDDGPTSTQQVSWYNRRSRFIKAYEAQLLLACVNTTLSDVAQKAAVSSLRLGGWATRVKRSSVRCFDSFLETLNLHKEDVSNDFPECYNSGFVEGLNDKIKVTSSLAAMV